MTKMDLLEKLEAISWQLGQLEKEIEKKIEEEKNSMITALAEGASSLEQRVDRMESVYSHDKAVNYKISEQHRRKNLIQHRQAI